MLLAIVAAGPVPAHELRTPHCLDICPRERMPAAGTAETAIIVRAAYTLAADPATKFARWVAYRANAQTLAGKRPRRWTADPALAASATLEPDDYRGANAALGVDRGHLAPLASLGGSDGWEALNYLSNIVPQQSALNRGPWQKLESAERRLVRQGVATAVYVMTGPLYDHAMPALPGADEPHRVPSGYWKVVSIATAGGVERAAFIFDQDSPRTMSFCRARVALKMIERRTGLSFAPEGGSLVPLSGPARDLAPRLGCGRAAARTISGRFS